jgi:predicted AAA+ superfamily ATPase
VRAPAVLPSDLLVGVDAQAQALRANTAAFAAGRPANNALLWGARGAGKSALVKAICRDVAAAAPALKLVQAAPAALTGAADLLALAQASGHRVIVMIDDMSLDADGPLVRALKPALDGDIAGLGAGVIVYATSNRRHLLTRDPQENTVQDLFWRDTAEDRLALSDRFGLSLGFHPWDQDIYLRAIRGYAQWAGLSAAGLEADAVRWALTRGSRSGRTAWQFIVARAAQAGVALPSAPQPA